VLNAKVTEVEEVATEANSAATTALAAATTAQSSSDAAMAQAEAATDMAATNTLSISNILSNFTAWVLGTYLGALTLLDVAIAAGESIQVMAGKLQGQVNAIKARLVLVEDDLIYEVVTTSLVSSITISNDKDGNNLSLDKCILYVTRPETTGNVIHIQINGINGAVYNGYGGINKNFFQLLCGTIFTYMKYELYYNSSYNSICCFGSATYLTPSYGYSVNNGHSNPGSFAYNIREIKIFPPAGNFPIGTKIVLKKI